MSADQPAAPESSNSPPSPSSADVVGAFRALVRNQAKEDRRSKVPVRTRGFVAVVRDAQSLELLQMACGRIPLAHACYTFRYRLKKNAALGTLLYAAARDLAIAFENIAGVEPLGEIQPGLRSHEWPTLKPGTISSTLDLLNGAERGTISTVAMHRLFEILGDPDILRVGMRVVIFGEIADAEGDRRALDELQASIRRIFPDLPERVGIVLSGVPSALRLPEDGAHVLDISSIPGAGPSLQKPELSDGSAAQFKTSQLVPDLPTAGDHLDRDSYAASLATFLLHPRTSPPITVGLYGRWGTGKSSFFELLKRKLIRQCATSLIGSSAFLWHLWILSPAARNRKPDDVADELVIEGSSWTPAGPWRLPWRVAERLAQRRMLTVGFNAWQYDDAKQTWAGLASTISARLEHALPFWRRQLMRLKYAWRTNRSDVLLNFGLPVLLLALAAAVLLPWLTPERVMELAPEGEGNTNPLQGLLKSVLPAGSLLLLVWAVGWRLVEVLKPVSERVAGYLRRPDYRVDMGYQHRVIGDLKFLLAELAAARPSCRVLVYIDDLDRCSDEKIVEVLRATILILADCRLFVMFGMDTEMIRRAIVSHYEKLKVPLSDPEAFAESYLRKIVQIALYLPETLPERRFSFVESMFSDAAREAYRNRRAGVAPQAPAALEGNQAGLPYDVSSLRLPMAGEMVEDTSDELAALAELQAFLPDNARELKRFVNTHRFLKILLSASGASWSGSKQRALVKWLLFCAGWHTRVGHVLRYARAHSDLADCLRAAVADVSWDDRAREFARIGVPLSSAELLGDFALAARLSQYVQEDVSDPVSTPPDSPSASPPTITLPPAITVHIARRDTSA